MHYQTMLRSWSILILAYEIGAHQNTLESMTHVLLTMMAVALVYPKSAALCGVIWVGGRVIYGVGYAMGNPNYRTPGGIISHIGDIPLMVMALRIAANVITKNM